MAPLPRARSTGEAERPRQTCITGRLARRRERQPLQSSRQTWSRLHVSADDPTTVSAMPEFVDSLEIETWTLWSVGIVLVACRM